MSDEKPKGAPKKPRAKKQKIVKTREQLIAELDEQIKEVQQEYNELMEDRNKIAVISGWRVIPEIIETSLLDITDELTQHKEHRAWLMNPNNQIE